METRNKLQIDLVGKNSETFDRLSSKLGEQISTIIDSLSDSNASNSRRETVEDIMSITGEFVKARLQKPSLENLKIMAEIQEKYASAEEAIARTRKIYHETEAIKIDNARKKLKMLLELNNIRYTIHEGNPTI